jgi:membrane protein YqaA with SNARE-associated domain
VRAAWVLPALMVALSIGCLLGLVYLPGDDRLWYFLPFTFLGNSLAPIPYDGAVIYLGQQHPIGLVVVIGVVGTVIIEEWNMELLRRILAQDATRGFRRHPVTGWCLRMYAKAPFWSLVGTCILPIVPHYPMRVLATLARYPMWKYRLSVIIGRGGRYAWLAALGWAIPIPGEWIFAVSCVILFIAVRHARKMNREGGPLPEEA